MTTLTVPSYQVILRSQDGTGNNNEKTFNINLRNILPNTFTTYNIRSKFLSSVGSFGNSWVEVKWNITNTNQIDTSGGGTSLCFPKVLLQVDNEGELEGSVILSDFGDAPPLLITPSSQNLVISIHNHLGNPVQNMSSWTLLVECQPVALRPTRR